MTDKYTPSPRDYIDLKGKKYLPARRRVQWFRGEHPDWTINTSVVDMDFASGYAVIRAEVSDDSGRLIASGMKTETRSGFGDFVEKAETGAIARAVAIAGYGTEDALDLDEGERIADSPVAPRTPPPAAEPAHKVPDAQYRRGELAELMAAKGLDTAALGRIADKLGVAKGGRATPAQMDQIIALIDAPESSVPPLAGAPATDAADDPGVVAATGGRGVSAPAPATPEAFGVLIAGILEHSNPVTAFRLLRADEWQRVWDAMELADDDAFEAWWKVQKQPLRAALKAAGQSPRDRADRVVAAAEQALEKAKVGA